MGVPNRSALIYLYMQQLHNWLSRKGCKCASKLKQITLYCKIEALKLMGMDLYIIPIYGPSELNFNTIYDILGWLLNQL